MQARRTLVKSPPELWAELSDAQALGRRLQPLGEIRITRLEPESTVAWEGEHARGTVEIEASGWGTRVTLTAEPSDAPDEPGNAEGSEPEAEPPESEVSPEPAAEAPASKASPEPAAEPRGREPSPEPAAAPAATAADTLVASAPVQLETQRHDGPLEDEGLPQTTAALGQGYQPYDEPAAPEPVRERWSARRLLGWLGRRGRRDGHPAAPLARPVSPFEPPAVPEEPETIPAPGAPATVDEPEPTRTPAPPAALDEPEDTPLPAPTATVDEPQAESPASAPNDPPQPVPEHDAAGLPERGRLEAARLDELLTKLLDDLGAAHHRPFSRG